jgi:hypothetical protein
VGCRVNYAGYEYYVKRSRERAGKGETGAVVERNRKT